MAYPNLPVIPADVAAIMKDIDPDILGGIGNTPSSFNPFILAADAIVTGQIVPKGILSQTQLYEVERWLAAHFVAVADPRRQSESAGVDATYRGQNDKYLSFTEYGQQAVVLDLTRTLLALDKGKPVVSLNTLRTQIPYHW